jgi:hypothetical protein
MNSFGYKMGWFAIRNANQKSILAALGLNAIKEVSWDEGIDTIYDSKDGTVFITPPVNSWTFVVGRWTAGTCEEKGIQDIEKLITELSTQFDEVQAFATHRIIEYHHWMLAKNGHLIRSFAYIGESGEVLTNKGKLTPIEESYEWDKLDKFVCSPVEEDELDESEWLPDEEDELDEFWFPDEETVMEVAGAWSINPAEIEDLSLNEDSGILASGPETTGNNNRFVYLDTIFLDKLTDAEEFIFDEEVEIKKPWWKFW